MITIVKCSIPSQLNNMPRVVVTDFRLHHTSSLIIVWLHSLSGVIRSLFCNPHAFSAAIIIMLAAHILSCSCLRKVCSCVSEALMLAMRVLFCACLRNVSSTVSKGLSALEQDRIWITWNWIRSGFDPVHIC